MALVTGGGIKTAPWEGYVLTLYPAAGMGYAVAQKLASKGWRIALLDLNEETGAKAAETLGSNCIFVKANITIYEDQIAAFERTVDTFGGIDFVFANAGIPGKAGFFDKAEKWPPSPPSLLVQDVCLTGTIYTSQLAMHCMRRNTVPGGSVVMTASGKLCNMRTSVHVD